MQLVQQHFGAEERTHHLYEIDKPHPAPRLAKCHDVVEILVGNRRLREVEGVLHPFGYSQWNVNSGERLSWLEVHSISRDGEATVAAFAKP